MYLLANTLTTNVCTLMFPKAGKDATAAAFRGCNVWCDPLTRLLSAALHRDTALHRGQGSEAQ